MIVVIADDITGAAELGGIGLRYGLRVLIAADVQAKAAVDLLVVYTNARSMKKQEAVALMKDLTTKAAALGPALFYKKTDSVLRGHVLAEMQVQMAVMGKEKGLLVPANPSLGRTIKEGQYFINGELIHQTGFSTDPEFPVQSSGIKGMLAEPAIPVNVIRRQSKSLPEGISVGEAETVADVAHWASQKMNNVFYAGGASFFEALLQNLYTQKKVGAKPRLSMPLLLVSGTSFQKNKDRVNALANLASYMPDALFRNDSPADEAENWCNETVAKLKDEGKAIVAIGDKEGKADARILREKMSEVVKAVSQKIVIRELLVEGGSTAYAVIQKLGWQYFTPSEELAQGVVRMKVGDSDDIHLTIKPGSYEWPAEWHFNQ
jgi:uncharacterized protein YgbK (DUF1537 family)